MSGTMILTPEQILIPADNIAYVRPATKDENAETVVFLKSGGHILLPNTRVAGIIGLLKGDPF